MQSNKFVQDLGSTSGFGEDLSPVEYRDVLMVKLFKHSDDRIVSSLG